MNASITANFSPYITPSQLHALQCAVNMESFWRASLALIRKALPQKSCALFSDINGFQPAQLRYHVVAPRNPDYVPAKSLSVSAPYLSRHSNIESYSYAEIISEDPLAPERRLAQEPDPEWNDFVALAFWRRAEPHSVLAVFGPEDITKQDQAFLRELRPTIDAGLTRLWTLENERSISTILQGHLQNSPEALVFFDRRGAILYQNTQGESQLSRWNRSLRRGHERSSLPVALYRAFNGSDSQLIIEHPELPGLSATMQGASSGYVLRFIDKQTLGNISNLAPQALASLQKLTTSEQRVARLAGEGLRTNQIAERLCRSPRTVEFQLSSVFRKLDIESRVQLARLLS